MKLTIDDIVRISGYSRATVCRVLAGKKNVRDSTRQAITNIIKENNYTSSSMERNWGHQHPVALIVGDLVDKESSFQLFHPQIIKTICQRMQKIGRECLIFDSGYSPEKEDEFIKRCIDLEVAGIFLLSATGTSLCLQNAAQRIPIVTINRHANTPFTDAILLDEYKCAYLAVQHLYELGHREICMVREPKEIPLAYEMTRGYLDVCSQYKLWSAKKRIYQCDANYDDGFKLGRKILECNEKISGLFCVSYDMAAGIEAAFKEAGKIIPDDLSIVIFQYVFEQAQKNKERFTSVGAYNLEEIANAAVDTMIQRFEEGEKPNARRLSVMMDTYLIEGSSSAPYREG